MSLSILSRASTAPVGCTFALAAILALAGCVAGPDRAAREEPPYIPGSGYHLMMAEIAIQRGSYGTAAEEYLNAAEHSDDPELSQRAAEFAFDYGFDGIALRAARRWAGLEPDNTSVHLYLVRLHLRRNDLQSALQETERALDPPDQRDDEDYLLLIRELGQESNAAGLTRLLTRLAARSPESPGLRLGLAMAALSSGDFDLALESAHAAVSEETVAEASQLIARALMARGDTDEAMDYLARQIETNPTLQLQLERARVLASAEKHTEALEELAELATRYPDEPEITRLRGLVSLDAGDTETAWENFTALLTSGQGTYESLFYMGEVAEKNQRYDQALRFYGRIGEGPFLIPAQAAIVRLAERSGDPQSALQRLDQFVRDHPRYAADARQLRAGLLERIGRHEEALETLDDALSDRPDDEALLLGRGALLERSGRLEDALADMRAAVAVAPDSAAALNALGYTLANRTREHDEAYRLVRRALEIEPDSAAILDSLGWVLYRQGHWPEARTYLSLAHSRFPDPEVAAHLGEVMWKQGERDAARRLWADALEKSPESEPLKETIARFRQ